MGCDVQKCAEISCTCAVFNLRRAARAVTARYEAALRPLGLTANQFSLLVGSRMMGPVTMSRLAEAMVMDRTTLTRNLRPLEKAGLVQVVPGSDRRTRAITITTAGREILDRALPLWEQAQGEILDGLGRARFQGLLGDLGQMVTLTQSS